MVSLVNTYRLIQKKFATPTLTPINRPQTAHKLKKIVNMNTDTSETIGNWDLRFRFRSLVSNAHKRPKLWLL